MDQRQALPNRGYHSEIQAYLFLSPTLILIGLFLISPMITGLVMSFYKTSLSGTTQFVGLRNYWLLLTEARFLNNIRLSMLYVLGNLAISLPIAYSMALLITSKLKAASLLRGVFLLPWIVAPIVSTVLFRSLVDPAFGPLSWMIEKIIGHSIVLLAHPTWSMAVIIIHSVWRSLPFMTLFLAAGIAMIPKELYEAAMVDGAGKWKQFFTLTFPLTKIHLVIVLLTITLWTLQDAETVYAMTEGGPGYSTEVMAVRLFKESFLNFDLNSGAALGVLLLLVGLIFMILYVQFAAKREER
ncbi:MAG: sugar ABC transporter permease [candidate division KSB1 bacterium]|nr:sugar ABC transporter permease [candidate division KSB1 bacterium]MDZ7336341.1 sugar ABC transporter permease [candidate division KSB1 bacterium]MDZ7359056.1 sugar ABC transporter permease [candidate division KSB1 bacterium]MDZ7377251.1 sugar ABC transporter permease [candidate division KSB1 bacterium]